MRNQILVKGFKTVSKGKNRGFEYSLTLEIPDLMGMVDSKVIGGMFANEAIDYIRQIWERGELIRGGKRQKTEWTDKARAIKKALLTGQPDENREFTRWLRGKSKDPKIRKKIRKLRRHFTYNERGIRQLNGVKTRYSKRHRFLPDPNNPAIEQSGLMKRSLKGVFKPSRQYRNKSTGKMVNVSSSIIMRVAKSRQQAALLAGLTPKNAQWLISQMNRNKTAFRRSNQLVNNAIYWGDKRANVVKALMVMRVVFSLLNFAMRS